MGMWDSMGIDALGSLIEGGINMGLSEFNRQRNFKFNEMAADKADQRQRAQFRDMYSYSAQVGEMRKAGLNPALMYSGGASGQGGATAPQSLGAGGVQGGYSHFDPMNAAEIAVMQSQANLNNAEAKKAGEETTAQQLQNYITDLTKETSVEERKQNLQLIVALGEKYMAEANLTNWRKGFEELKSNEEFKMLVNQNALYLAQIATEGTKQELNEQQTTTLNKQIDKWQIDAAQRYYELDIKSWNQAAQENWWESQAENLTNRLEFDTKKVGLELDFGKKKLWVESAIDIGKSIIYGTALTLSRSTIALPNTGNYKGGKIGF